MKQKIIMMGVISIVIILLFSGCTIITHPDKEKFIGTWKSENNRYPLCYTIIFFSDNTCNMDSLSGSWEIKDNKLMLDIDGVYGMTLIYNYNFSNNTLTLSKIGNDLGIVYIKQ